MLSKKEKVKGKMEKGNRKTAAVLSFFLLTFSFLLSSCGGDPANAVPANAKMGRCPVCGMNVDSSDQWAAEIYYVDGTKIVFESLGDLLSFYTAPQDYKASEYQRDRANILRTTVKDYQTKQVIDARGARLVYKSKVEGPMGPEFLAFAGKEDADAFVAANGGEVVPFRDVSPAMAKDLRKK